jgi:uncharacterized protein (DUF2141 family)
MKYAIALHSVLAKSLLFAATVAQAQTCTPVEVHNVRAGEGRLMLVGYDSATDFSSKTLSAAVQLRADAELLSLQICGLKGPVVALSAFQDLNSNGKLDTNAMGMPGEPWGASGKPSNFGPPTWEATQVPLDGKPIVIKLSK